MKANRFAQTFGFSFMALLKLISRPFYKFETVWLSDKQFSELDKVRLIVVLNHTSLYEALLVGLSPFRFLWRIAGQVIIPVADDTTKRPVVGMFFKGLLPGAIPISRKRDESWQRFLDMVGAQSIVAILPEGRMRRHDGNDKHGKPMSVKAGVADIIERLDDGDILFVYNGGMHHIQIPGQRFPRLFKKIKVNLELVSVKDYKQSLYHEDSNRRKVAYVHDIQRRVHESVPYCPNQPYNKNKRT